MIRREYKVKKMGVKVKSMNTSPVISETTKEKRQLKREAQIESISRLHHPALRIETAKGGKKEKMNPRTLLLPHEAAMEKEEMLNESREQVSIDAWNDA